ncbi:MAG: hypothetical protein AAF985_13200 [Bacteroidota bacterium]
MKRRIFLATSGTVGMASVVSGSTVISSVYSSINSSMLIDEFSAPVKKLFDQFVNDVTTNVQSLGLDEKWIKQISMPVHIVKKTDGKEQHIVFKNKSGHSIGLSVGKKEGKIHIA